MSPQISSVLVAAEAMMNLSAMWRLDTISFKMNSAIGERQILPWQMNNTFIIVIKLLKSPGNAVFCGYFRDTGFSFIYVSTRQIIA